MKTTTTLRILFTLAILVGLAAAPSAQTFRWEAGRSYDAQRRAERAIEQARRTVERQLRLAERRVESIQRQVKRRVERRVSRSRGFNYGDNAGAQVGTNDDPCSNRYNNRDEDYFQHCEVRNSTMPAGPINVDAGNNGGIVIEAWDRNEIRVRAVVQGSARSESRAREVAGQVQVQAGGGRVYSTGPELERREWWSVSYRINVPRKNDLDLRASNGGITIVGVTGNMRFDTTNGGVKLQDVGGRVNGGTRNGGLNVVLNGNKWDGDGLDVETSNGGVTLQIPDGYNAELETRTVNGSLRIDFPITVQGELTSRRGISTTLGSGGPLVRARTTNGGVKISRRM
jgi:Putative adhesin